MKAARILALLLVSASVGACALLPKHHAAFAKVTPVKITPVSTPITDPGRPDDGFYADAARAINARDYATALEALENARQRDANDIRVLNAFGVVYDKLGRFDLSTRYYGLAAAIDPASAIVKQNVAYSLLLQRAARHEAGPAFAAAITPEPRHLGQPVQMTSGVARLESPAAGRLVEIAPGVTQLEAPVGRLVEISPGVVRIEGPSGSPPVLRLPRGITGHPLALVDASGGRGIEPVRVSLKRLGWTTPRLAERTAPVQAHSEIIYSGSARVVALALARTLPRGVSLVACGDGCKGVRLVLGSDSVTWKRRGGRDVAARRV